MNIKFLCHLHELDSNEMARPGYYKTTFLKSVYFYSRQVDNRSRDIVNRVSSNKCRLVCILDKWLKKALEDSARVGLSENVCQNAVSD